MRSFFNIFQSVVIRQFLLIAMTISAFSRAFVVSPMARRTISKPSSSLFQPNLFSTTSQIKHTLDDNRDLTRSLTRTEIRKLRVVPLREELAKRGLDTCGTRDILVSRLLDTVDHRTGPAANKKDIFKKKQSRRTDAGCHDPLHPERKYVLRISAHSKPSSDAAGAGLVLWDADAFREVWRARKYFPQKMTKFESEYQAAILGLKYARRQGATKIVLQTDNEVMLKQINGEYNVKKDALRDLCYATMQALKTFAEYDLVKLCEAENSSAKNLARRAIGTQKSVGLPDSDAEEQPTDASEQVERIAHKVPEWAPPSENDASVEKAYKGQDMSVMLSPDETYLLRFDGGSRGNPGTAGSGMVLYDMDNMQEVWCGWSFLGDGHTNNEAEYDGLLKGLECALSMGVKKLVAEGDSQLVVRHLNGIYRVKNSKLKVLFNACKRLIDAFDEFHVEYIPRDDNQRADQLANHAMDTRESFGFEEK